LEAWLSGQGASLQLACYAALCMHDLHQYLQLVGGVAQWSGRRSSAAGRTSL